MAEHPGGKRRPLGGLLGGWLYAGIFEAGWPRKLFLIVAAALAVIAVLLYSGRTDHTSDPSLLVPRSASVYLEAKELGPLLKNVGAWRLWNAGRRSSNQEEWNQLEKDLAGAIGARGGLGTRLPAVWLSAAKKAAFCLLRADGQGAESWAIYLRMDNPPATLFEISAEPGTSMELVEKSPVGEIYSFSGGGTDGGLFFGVLKPWFIISSDARLPAFAIQSLKNPATTLQRTRVLPDWKRAADVRGVFDPVYLASSPSLSDYAGMGAWIAPDARIGLFASVGDSGKLETTFVPGILPEKPASRGGRFLLFTMFYALGILGVLVILSIALVAVGWGGWLKALALKKGIAPAGSPGTPELSPAFREDAGMEAHDESAAAVPSAAALPDADAEVSVPRETAAETGDTVGHFDTQERTKAVSNDVSGLPLQTSENSTPGSTNSKYGIEGPPES